MTDGQRLLLLFCVLYLAECLRLVPAGVRLLVSAGSHGVLRRAFAPLDFAGRRLLLLPALPPAPAHVFLAPWPWVPCEKGLELLDAEGSPAGLVAWADLNPSVKGKSLSLTPVRRVLFHHPALAQARAEQLLQWRKMKPEACVSDFEKQARGGMDTLALSVHVEEGARSTQLLRGLTVVIFMVCFGVIPLVYRLLGDSVEILWIALLLLVLMWVQAALFWRAAGRLPQGSMPFRFWKALAMMFMPQFALRAADHLLEARPCETHPLAAWTVLKEKERLALARHFWKAARHPGSVTATTQQRVLGTFWKKHGLDEAQLEEVPERQPGSAAYCPHCSAQFRDAAMLCQDCGGVPLKPF